MGTDYDYTVTNEDIDEYSFSIDEIYTITGKNKTKAPKTSKPSPTPRTKAPKISSSEETKNTKAPKISSSEESKSTKAPKISKNKDLTELMFDDPEAIVTDIDESITSFFNDIDELNPLDGKNKT